MSIRGKPDVRWDRSNLSLSLFVYKSVRSGRSDEVTKFIHAFKASNDYGCLKTAMVEVYEIVRECIEEWKRDYS